MKQLLFATLTFLAASSSYADISCVSSRYPELTFQFLSGHTTKFEAAHVRYSDGSLSEADLLIDQIYASPTEFRALASFDEQPINIRSSWSGKAGEYAVYTGIMAFRHQESPVVCIQETP